MNILVIGNGFDLAHNLPTRYTDFLDFVDEFSSYYENIYPKVNFDKKVKISDILSTLIYNYQVPLVNDGNLIKEFYTLIENNVWITHFKNSRESELWVDFENEISNIVTLLDKFVNTKEDNLSENIYLSSNKSHILIDLNNFKKLETIVANFENCFFQQDNNRYSIEKNLIVGIRDNIFNDLNKLTRALEIYLSLVSETYTDLDILDYIENLKVDHVLSFNYTNTFKKLYDKYEKSNIKYDFIHGYAHIEREYPQNIDDDFSYFQYNVDTCNLILGIDEYLPDDEKDKNLFAVKFKKFYQRIYKRTGCVHKDWLKNYTSDVKESEKRNDYSRRQNLPVANFSFDKTSEKILPFNVYFFGHSLDVTDKDIIKDLIDNEYSKVTIYYHNDEDYSRKIINLIKIIGQDKLTKSAHGFDPKIKFIKQSEVNNKIS